MTINYYISGGVIINKHSYVYKITNKINSKTYIGRRRNNGENWETYYGSGKLITRAIKAEGKDNFTKELIEYCSECTIQEREEYWIRHYKDLGKAEYNISLSGYANTARGNYWEYMTEEERSALSKKLSKSQRTSKVAKRAREERKRKTKARHSLLVNKHNSEVIDMYVNEKMNIREIHKFLNIPSSVVSKILHKNNIKLRHQNKFGHKISQEQKDNISKGLAESRAKAGFVAKVYEHTCLHCDLKFTHKSNARMYCSRECKDANPYRKHKVPTYEDKIEMMYIYDSGELNMQEIAKLYNTSNIYVGRFIKEVRENEKIDK